MNYQLHYFNGYPKQHDLHEKAIPHIGYLVISFVINSYKYRFIINHRNNEHGEENYIQTFPFSEQALFPKVNSISNYLSIFKNADYTIKNLDELREIFKTSYLTKIIDEKDFLLVLLKLAIEAKLFALKDRNSTKKVQSKINPNKKNYDKLWMLAVGYLERAGRKATVKQIHSALRHHLKNDETFEDILIALKRLGDCNYNDLYFSFSEEKSISKKNSFSAQIAKST